MSRVPVTMAACEDAKRQLVRELRERPGFVGAGVAVAEDGTPCVAVQVVDAESARALRIPPRIAGVPVTVEVVGQPRKL